MPLVRQGLTEVLALLMAVLLQVLTAETPEDDLPVHTVVMPVLDEALLPLFSK